MGALAARYRKNMKTREEIDKFNNSAYLTPYALMGYHHIYHYAILSSRGRGKSVITLDAALAAKEKYGWDNVKIYYFRISDMSTKELLANNGSKAVDPILVDRYNLELTSKRNIIYNRGKPLMECYSLVSAAKNKGLAQYDANWLNNRPLGKNGKPIKRFMYFILDEFLMAEGVEKKSVGDPLSQWRLYIGTILRNQEELDYDAVKIFYLANSVGECAHFLGGLFNYIPTPGDFGIKKLTRKHAMIWNVPNSQEYMEKYKRSIAATIMNFDNDPNYTNIAKRDLSLVIPKSQRLRRVTAIIQFDRLSDKWFCVYDGIYIKIYNNETVKKSLYIPMYRHLDSDFNLDVTKNILAQYDVRGFRYANIMSMALFQACMKEFKNK